MARTRGQSRDLPAARTDGDAQWRSLPPSYRALVIRDRVDGMWIRLAGEHQRILSYCGQVAEVGLLAVPPTTAVNGLADAASFIATLRRALRLCELVRRSGPPLDALRLPVRLFQSQVEAVAALRNMQEHIDSSTINGLGGIGYGIMPDRLLIAYEDARFDTRRLLEAARVFHAAVRTVVDPIASQDPHFRPSFVALDPVE